MNVPIVRNLVPEEILFVVFDEHKGREVTRTCVSALDLRVTFDPLAPDEVGERLRMFNAYAINFPPTTHKAKEPVIHTFGTTFPINGVPVLKRGDCVKIAPGTFVIQAHLGGAS